MGKGYWILLADGFGSGLTLRNPRLHTEGVDRYGNELNWWPNINGEDEIAILKRHSSADGIFRKVIFTA